MYTCHQESHEPNTRKEMNERELSPPCNREQQKISESGSSESTPKSLSNGAIARSSGFADYSLAFVSYMKHLPDGDALANISIYVWVRNRETPTPILRPGKRYMSKPDASVGSRFIMQVGSDVDMALCW